jgi:hypothetical protein
MNAWPPVIKEGDPVPAEGGIVFGSPLLAAANLERKIREENARHERAITDLQDEYETIIGTAIDLGHLEERHPWGTYRVVEKITPGRRSLDAEKFEQLYPDLCETVVKAVVKVPTLAKAEKALSAASLALVVKHGEPKVTRELAFEHTPPAAIEECEP